MSCSCSAFVGSLRELGSRLGMKELRGVINLVQTIVSCYHFKVII